MKIKFGFIKRIIILVFTVQLLFSLLISCQRTESHQTEINVMQKFMYFFDEDDEKILTIKRFEKYIVSEDTDYYFVEWVCPINDDYNSYQSLLTYNTNTRECEFYSMADVEYGLYVDIGENWENAKNSSPDAYFTAAEIIDIKHKAINQEKRIKSME